MGDAPNSVPHLDRVRFAGDLGAFLHELRSVPAATAQRQPPLLYRGCHPSIYGDQVQKALIALAGQVDVDACKSLWGAAMRSAWSSAPVWFHGGVAVGNLLTAEGQLGDVIDFGTCGIGDPACDLVIGWTFLRGEVRQIFREAVGLHDDAWARARGWALWKALITMTEAERPQYETQADTLVELLDEPVGA